MTKTNWSALQREESERLHQQQLREANDKLKSYSSALSHVTRERDAALAISKQRLHAHKILVGGGEESEATAFAVAGDWHVEETIDPKSVNGLNEFNLEIAEKRIDQFFRTTLRLTEIERAGTRIDNLVLCLLGDLMTGYIHEELQEANGLSPTETVLWLRSRIASGIKFLKAEGKFKSITATCNYGNHGRTTKKPRHATGASNSYEWMLYQMLKDDVQGVDWLIADGYFLFLEVYGRLFRLHHGENIHYQGGIGGLTIPCEKAVASWNKARAVYMDIFGHHHTAQQSPRWICNGPLIGYGAYSIAVKAGYEPPSQTFFLLDSKRGRTCTWPIFLD